MSNNAAVERVDLCVVLKKPWVPRNQWDRMHWGAKGRIMQGLAREIGIQLQAYGFDSQFQNVEIEALRVDWRTLDRDNLVAGLKPVLDAMVARTKRNPHGIGLILDDRPTLLGKLDAHQDKLPKACASEFRSEITLSGIVVPAYWCEAGYLRAGSVGTQ